MRGSLRDELPLRVVRRLSRNVVHSTPPPLPLISLPPDDEWEEFDTPTRSGFNYTLPHLELPGEEYEDLSSTSLPLTNSLGRKREVPDHERPKISRLLSEYMSHNEIFQTQRHGFGIDTRLIYKRNKEADAVVPVGGVGPLDSLEDLRFNAFFESGNLDRAYRVLGRHYASSNELLGAASHGTSSANSQPPFAFFVKVDMEYDLYCDTDLNTHGHIQWYFFRVTLPAALKQANASLKVRFNIRNMLKRASLYNDGMLPAVYMEGPAAEGKRGWHHAGSNVCYYKNADTYRNRKSGKVQNYYTLSFVYEFQCAQASGDPVDAGESEPTVVYFAHCYPYTYTKLQKYLLSLQKDPDRNRNLKRRVLCKTIAGNNCDLLTITDFTQEASQEKPHHMKRTGVFLSARVHPGESNSSFVMHGIIDFLTGNSLEARYLRHNFVFKVVPMLNPDGVVHGNYRCSLAGTDLNRRWMHPSPDLHPTIFATKNAILSMKQTRPISLYCDIHGHSRRKNMFLYGCRPFEPNCRSEAARLRVFPHVLGKTSGSQRGGFYSFPDCTFSVSGSKKGTGRVVVWKEAEVLHSFTLEVSFFGVGTNKKQQLDSFPASGGSGVTSNNQSMKHFTPFDLRAAGMRFCHALLPFAQMVHLDRTAARAPAVDGSETSLHEAPPPCDTASPHQQSARAFDAVNVPTSPQPAPAVGPDSLDNKVRLAPLQLTAPPISNRTHSPAPQCLSQSLDSAAPTTAIPTSAATLMFSVPSEFDQLFADDSMSAMLALTDPEDLLKEIEATLSENLQEYGEDDASVGSESDPSGDNMEEEELRSAESWKNILAPTEDERVKKPTATLPKTRSRLTRHLSEPRM